MPQERDLTRLPKVAVGRAWNLVLGRRREVDNPAASPGESPLPAGWGSHSPAVDSPEANLEEEQPPGGQRDHSLVADTRGASPQALAQIHWH